MIKNVLTIVLLACSYCVGAQVKGKMFPDLVAETVEDKKVNLPADTKGKYTLLGLAYSKKSEDELNSWFSPVFSTFIQKTKGLMAGFGYDVHVYFVPMFTGVNAAATGTAKKRAAKDIPYFFVLDPEGKIVYATSGKYSDDKMAQIEEVIE